MLPRPDARQIHKLVLACHLPAQTTFGAEGWFSVPEILNPDLGVFEVAASASNKARDSRQDKGRPGQPLSELNLGFDQ